MICSSINLLDLLQALKEQSPFQPLLKWRYHFTSLGEED